MSAVLERWNEAEAGAAAREILPCCGSHRWAEQMVKRRLFHDAESVYVVSDAVWLALDEPDWDEAFRSHPRIGERKAQATEESLRWSALEQQSAMSEDDAVKQALAEANRLAMAEGNRRYEERFGRIFLICASGKSAREILTNLEARLQNDAATELREAVEQQRQITQLRLRRWLEEG